LSKIESQNEFTQFNSDLIRKSYLNYRIHIIYDLKRNFNNLDTTNFILKMFDFFPPIHFRDDFWSNKWAAIVAFDLIDSHFTIWSFNSMQSLKYTLIKFTFNFIIIKSWNITLGDTKFNKSIVISSEVIFQETSRNICFGLYHNSMVK
jgi:hypothetical protein